MRISDIIRLTLDYEKSWHNLRKVGMSSRVSYHFWLDDCNTIADILTPGFKLRRLYIVVPTFITVSYQHGTQTLRVPHHLASAQADNATVKISLMNQLHPYPNDTTRYETGMITSHNYKTWLKALLFAIIFIFQMYYDYGTQTKNF